MKLSQEQIATGRERFLDVHPQVKAKVQSITQAEADALDDDLAKIQNTEAHKAIEQMARQAGEDSTEYLLRYVLDNEEERQKAIQALREERLRSILN